MMEQKSLDVILGKLPDSVRIPLHKCRSAYEDKITEITLRAERPLCLYEGSRMFFITENGFLTDSSKSEKLIRTTHKEIENIALSLCDYSLYAYQNEINSGFITIGAGVRVGLCGKSVIGKGEVNNIRDISTLSFRIAREVRNCSVSLLKKIQPLDGVLICGEPGSGKTTLIRDMARSLSYHYRVSLLDERSELSAYCRGRSSFDLGLCDIYAAYPKGAAANCAIRSMAPDIIVCDELGDKSDVDMLLYSMRCGVAFIASVHAASMNDLRAREMTSRLINTGAFRYIAFLGGRETAGRIAKIYEMSIDA